VNEMGPNSGVFIGNNRAPLWGSFSKQQTAFSGGNGNATGNRTYFWDRDRVDFVAIGPFKTKKKRTKKSRTLLRKGGNVRSKSGTSKL